VPLAKKIEKKSKKKQIALLISSIAALAYRLLDTVEGNNGKMIENKCKGKNRTQYQDRQKKIPPSILSI
jgi:hypothetical protein